MAAIEFYLDEDGRVQMKVCLDPRLDAIGGVNFAAYALARRGFTKREIERHDFPAYFAIDQIKETP